MRAASSTASPPTTQTSTAASGSDSTYDAWVCGSGANGLLGTGTTQNEPKLRKLAIPGGVVDWSYGVNHAGYVTGMVTYDAYVSREIDKVSTAFLTYARALGLASGSGDLYTFGLGKYMKLGNNNAAVQLVWVLHYRKRLICWVLQHLTSSRVCCILLLTGTIQSGSDWRCRICRLR